jgi:hypothetical protein
MIIVKESNSAALDAALEQTKNEPRHVWINGAETIIYTGEDIPED